MLAQLPSPPPARSRSAHRLLTLAIGFFLFAVLLLANACSSRADTAADPLAPYRAAMKPDGQEQLDLAATATRYTISATVDTGNRILTGTMDVALRNNSPDPWNHLIFRLYPNLDHYDGSMGVRSVSLNGGPTNFTYQDDSTSLRVLLPAPLLPGEEAQVSMSWTLGYPSYVNSPDVYVLFGRSQEMTSLPLFYPSLAVYQAGPTVGTGNWWLEQGTIRGDAAFNDIALFVVTATLPSGQVPVVSGTELFSETLPGDRTRYTWATGPAREFLIHMSPLFQSASEEAFGTTVTSYWLPGEEATGRSALRHAISSLRVFSDLYGAYPNRDMRVAPAPLGYRGMEYPQVILLGVDLYDRTRANQEVLVAHEMAHQWWYQVVHNDPVNSPWLDEGLAEYSVKLYMEELKGQAKADLLQYQRWQVPLNTVKERGSDAQVNQTVESFNTGTQYETIVYGKGALFFDELRQAMGVRPFKRFLQTYLNGHRYQIVTDDDFLAALHVLGKPDIVKLYQEWIGEPALQVSQPAGSN